jgi:hypothetical protein
MVAQKSLSVGDTVRFTLGTTHISGVVVDDRGPIGMNGIHIYQIRVPNSPHDDRVFEMPEDELSSIPRQEVRIPPDSIIDYLRHGGLLQILRSGHSGQKGQPRVWLSLDTLGNVVHAYREGCSSVGGAAVPCRALHNNRIFTPKLSEVAEFLKTFGLSDREAKRVTDAVGTNP